MNLHDGTELDMPTKLEMELMVSSMEEHGIQWSCVILILMNFLEVNKAYMNKYQTTDCNNESS